MGRVRVYDRHEPRHRLVHPVPRRQDAFDEDEIDKFFADAFDVGGGVFGPPAPPDPRPVCCTSPEYEIISDHTPGTVCVSCGTVVDSGLFRLGIERDSFKEIIPRTRARKSAYKPPYYWSERISQLQGHHDPIPLDVFQRIRLAVYRILRGTCSGRVDKHMVQRALARIGDPKIQRRYLERYPWIISQLSKRMLPVLSPGTDRLLRRDFSGVVSAWRNQVRPPGRKHLPYYSYLLLRLLERAGYPQLAFWLPSLKTKSKIHRTGLWWRDICRHNGWFPSRWSDTVSLYDRLVQVHDSRNPVVVATRHLFAPFMADARAATEYKGLDTHNSKSAVRTNGTNRTDGGGLLRRDLSSRRDVIRAMNMSSGLSSEVDVDRDSHDHPDPDGDGVTDIVSGWW